MNYLNRCRNYLIYNTRCHRFVYILWINDISYDIRSFLNILITVLVLCTVLELGYRTELESELKTGKNVLFLSNPNWICFFLDEIILLESVNEIRKQFESGQTRAATEKFKTLVETNNINLSIILSENTFYDIIKTLSIFQNDKLVSTKCKLLNILFRLTQNTVNSTQKLSQIVACARTALEMARCLQKNLLALSSIDETIFPFLKKCCEKADLLSLADEENEFAMKAWCKVYFCSCCNIIDKYSTAEEIAEQTILNLKLKFRDIASKYSVLAALYHVRATARKLAGQYDKAIKDYKHEIQSLTDVEDISGLERKQRLDIACEQLDATQKFIRNWSVFCFVVIDSLYSTLLSSWWHRCPLWCCKAKISLSWKLNFW